LRSRERKLSLRVSREKDGDSRGTADAIQPGRARSVSLSGKGVAPIDTDVESSWDWVAYTDETSNEDSYWICMVLVSISHIKAAQEGLSRVVSTWAGELGLRPEAELHGSDLWHRSGAFSDVVPGVRRAIYDNALTVLATAQPLIILRGVARRGLFLHPHRLAWRYAIERVDEEMERVGGTALVVADKHSETEAALRGDIVVYAESTTGGWRPRRITRVLRGLRFLDSTENRLLQAADLVAFLYQRRRQIPTEKHPRAHSAREAHWRRIEEHVVIARLWDPYP
jgi:hypothetical protein